MVMMATNLEDQFLLACKTEDIETVQLALQCNVDVNYQQGWGLRRAVRYNHPHVWQYLLHHKDIQVNLPNQYGLSALHTACRFNIPGAILTCTNQPPHLPPPYSSPLPSLLKLLFTRQILFTEAANYNSSFMINPSTIQETE